MFSFRKFYLYFVESCDKRIIPSYLRMVNTDRNSPDFGNHSGWNGTYDYSLDFAILSYSVFAYTSEECIWYRSEKVLDLMTGVAGHSLCKTIHEDGTTDNIITNFHQPELFSVSALCSLYRVLCQLENKSEKELELIDLIYMSIKKMSGGLVASGFHTPNHRWVLTAALYSAYNVLKEEDKNPALLEMAQKYLNEKIDIDENGDYSERSAGMYSMHTDRALAVIAREGHHPELYECIKKNLTLVYKYLETGTTIFTQNSTRKDKGEVGTDKLFDFGGYLDICIMAYYDSGDPFFVQAAGHVLNRTIDAYYPTFVYQTFAVYPKAKTDIFELKKMEEFPENFHLFEPSAGIVRRRYEGVSTTLMANKSGFLNFAAGNVSMTVRMCSSYFAVAQFMPEVIEETGKTSYHLRYAAEAGYKLPFDNPPEHSEQYWTMDYSSRKDIQKSRYVYDVQIEFKENQAKLKIKADGMDYVPFKIEFICNPNLFVTAGSTMMVGKAGSFLCAREGKVRLEDQSGGYVEIDGAFCRHFYHEDMRGSVPVPKGKFSVYFTDFSPVDREITITCGTGAHWDYFGGDFYR